jgi:hypothetical protein
VRLIDADHRSGAEVSANVYLVLDSPLTSGALFAPPHDLRFVVEVHYLLGDHL